MAATTRAHTILICEDDPSVSSLFRDILELAGHRVISTPSGAAALELARLARPDAIVLDLALPDLDGAAVLGRLKEDPLTAAIPVVIASAYPGWLTFLDRGLARIVLEKPCAPADLEAAVDEVLGVPR